MEKLLAMSLARNRASYQRIFSWGIFVALINSILDVFFNRLGIPTASTFLNDLIIGAAAGLLAYIWMSRQNAKNELEFSTRKRLDQAINLDRKLDRLRFRDTVCQAQTGLHHALGMRRRRSG